MRALCGQLWAVCSTTRRMRPRAGETFLLCCWSFLFRATLAFTHTHTCIQCPIAPATSLSRKTHFCMIPTGSTILPRLRNRDDLHFMTDTQPYSGCAGMPSSNTDKGWGFEINLDEMEQAASSHVRNLRDTETNLQDSDKNNNTTNNNKNNNSDDDDDWYTKQDRTRPAYSDRGDNYSYNRRPSSSIDNGEGRDGRQRFSQDTGTIPTDDVWGVGTIWPAPRQDLSQGSDDEESLDAITAYWATDPYARDLVRSSKRKKPKPATTTFHRKHRLETDSWGDAPQAFRPYGHDPSDILVEQRKQEFWSQDDQGRWYLLNSPNSSHATTMQRAMTRTTTTKTTMYTSLERRSMEGSVDRQSMLESMEHLTMEATMDHGSMDGPEIQDYRSEEDERDNYEEDNEEIYDNGWRDYEEAQVVRTVIPPRKLPGSESLFSLSDDSDKPQAHYRSGQQRKYKVEWLPEDLWRIPRGRVVQPPKDDDPWEMSNAEDEDNTLGSPKSPSPSPSSSQASNDDYPDFHAPLSLDFSTAKPYHDDYDTHSVSLPSDAISRLPAGLLEGDEDDDTADAGDIAPTGSPTVFLGSQKDIQESSLLDLDTEIEMTPPVQGTSRSASSSSLLDMSHEDEAKPTTPPLLELLKRPTQEPRDHEITPSMALLDQERPPRISLLDQSTCTISLDQESLVPTRTISLFDQANLAPMASLLNQDSNETVPANPSIAPLLDDLVPHPSHLSQSGTEDDTLLSMAFDNEADNEPADKVPNTEVLTDTKPSVKELTGKEPAHKDSVKELADKELDKEPAGNKDTISANHRSLIDIDPFVQVPTSPPPKPSQSHFEFGVHSWLDKLGAQNKKFHEESLQTNKLQWDSLMAKQQEDSKKLDEFIQRSTTLTEKKGGSACEKMVAVEGASVVAATKKMVKAQTPFSLQVDIETIECGFQSIHVTERDNVDQLEELVDAFCAQYRMDAYKMAIFASVASAIKRKKKMIKKNRLEAKLAA